MTVFASNDDDPISESDGTTLRPPVSDPGNSSPENWTEELDDDTQQTIRDRLAEGDA